MKRLDFFSKIEAKYDIGLNTKRCIVIRFDARNTTKNTKINLLDEREGSYSYAMKKACKTLTEKYKYMYIYIASDEVNMIVLDSKKFLENFKSNNAQEITCTMAQELYYEFHKNFTNQIFFAGRSFSLYEDNLKSYLIYRKHSNIPTLTIYYLKKYFPNINRIGIKYLDLNNYAEKNVKGYTERTEYQKQGVVCYKGEFFSVEEVIKTESISLLYNQRYNQENLEIDYM